MTNDTRTSQSLAARCSLLILATAAIVAPMLGCKASGESKTSERADATRPDSAPANDGCTVDCPADRSDAKPEPPPDPLAHACASFEAPAGHESCRAVELTGEAPCELICLRARQMEASECCVDPVDALVFGGAQELLRIPACTHVPPECAHVHGHGNMDARLRVLEGETPELIVVEGGCEMRAQMHGYVPDGVAAWTGCEHQRYRWDGERFVQQPDS